MRLCCLRVSSRNLVNLSAAILISLTLFAVYKTVVNKGKVKYIDLPQNGNENAEEQEEEEEDYGYYDDNVVIFDKLDNNEVTVNKDIFFFVTTPGKEFKKFPPT